MAEPSLPTTINSNLHCSLAVVSSFWVVLVLVLVVFFSLCGIGICRGGLGLSLGFCGIGLGLDGLSLGLCGLGLRSGWSWSWSQWSRS